MSHGSSMLEHAEKGRQILLQNDVLFWRVPPFLLMLRYLVILPHRRGLLNGVAEWSCRTCMRSSREWSQLASVIARLLGRPETFSLHNVVDFPLSAWHLGSKGTHRSASGGKICETRSVVWTSGQKCFEEYLNFPFCNF